MDLISSVYTHTHTLNKSLQSVKRPALFRQTPVVSVIQYQSMAQKFPGVKGHTQSEVGNTSHGEQINTQIKAWVVCYGFKLNMTKYADFRVLSCLSCFPSSMFFCTKILVKCEWKLFSTCVWVRKLISGPPENGHVGNFLSNLTCWPLHVWKKSAPRARYQMRFLKFHNRKCVEKRQIKQSIQTEFKTIKKNTEWFCIVQVALAERNHLNCKSVSSKNKVLNNFFFKTFIK